MKPKLQKVCNYYLLGMSMREALLKAGYSDAYASHNSSKFLHNREVMNYIRQRQKDEAEVALADAIMVKKKLIALTENNDPYVALTALKQLDAHNEWMAELEAKFKAMEASEKQPKEDSTLIIKLDVAKKDE